ncbi:hypothetical protein [Metallosphaera tengchongensis]|uniref:hypothetical protein n=1 Tax=Metallosphaera tengchongensis TaxID=1532350 RepID=UPI001C2EFB50|nr:hypothetical protein [Metallosphaera tengchongensis]
MDRSNNSKRDRGNKANANEVKYVYARDYATFRVLSGPEKTKYSYRVRIRPISGEFYDAKEGKTYDAKDLRDYLVYLNVKEEDVKACRPGNVVVKRSDGLAVIDVAGHKARKGGDAEDAERAGTRGGQQKGDNDGNRTQKVEQKAKDFERLSQKGTVEAVEPVENRVFPEKSGKSTGSTGGQYPKNSNFIAQQKRKSTGSTGPTVPLRDKTLNKDNLESEKSEKSEGVNGNANAKDNNENVKCINVNDEKVGTTVEVCGSVVSYVPTLRTEFRSEDRDVAFYVTEVPKYNITIKYKDKEYKCDGNCDKIAGLIAKQTDSHPSKKAVLEAVKAVKEGYAGEETPVCEYVMSHFPDLYREAEKDIIGFMLRNSEKYVHGYGKQRELTVYSAFSAFLKPVYGMTGLHLMLIGGTGAGKSTAVKSILFQFPDDVVAPFSRLSQNFLGYNTEYYPPIIFIEQIDGQDINYMRELMTEGQVMTGTVEKGEDGQLTTRVVKVKYKPVFITTSVIDVTNAVKAQIENRFFKAYVNTKTVDIGEAVGKMGEREGDLEYPFEVKAVIACFLSRMPKQVRLSEEVNNAIKQSAREKYNVLGDYGVVTRASSQIMVLVRVHSALKLKAVADISDYNEVMSEFYNEVLFDALGLTERDVEYLRYVRDAERAKMDRGEADPPKTDDVMTLAREHKKDYVLKVLRGLERKGLLDSDKPGKAFVWSLTKLGRGILDYVEGETGGGDTEDNDRGNGGNDVIRIKTQNGEVLTDKDFFRGSDRGRGKANAVSGDGGGVQKGEGQYVRGHEEISREMKMVPVKTSAIHRLRIRNDDLARLVGIFSCVGDDIDACERATVERSRGVRQSHRVGTTRVTLAYT